MKKFSLFLIVCIIAISSCKKDSTTPATTSTPTPTTPFTNLTVNRTQQSLVMIETATWCEYCGQWGDPTFDAAMSGSTNGIDSTRVNGLELHASSSDPLYCTLAANIADTLVTGATGIPALWIDFNTSYYLNPSGWDGAIASKQGQTTPPPCALALSKVKNGNSYTVYVKVQFYTTETGTYNIAVYATENDVVANQYDINSSGGFYWNATYVHNYVLRGEITNNASFGTQLFKGSSKSEYDLTYTYKVPTGVNINNVNFTGVIYIMNGKTPTSSPNSCTIK